MNEEAVINQIKKSGIDFILNLPCDKNKLFTSMIYGHFKVIDLTREEDGVGIGAGIALTGGKFALSIQSSGLGNMMNAIMSLTSVYSLPLPILASWRGMEDETIEAQIPFNSGIIGLLENYGIDYVIISEEKDVEKISESLNKSYSDNKPIVMLIKPGLWGKCNDVSINYPDRCMTMSLDILRTYPIPVMKRLDAIREIMHTINEEDIIVSNIGIPSKEVFATKHRSLNFYMLGSYTQVTPIGLGISMNTDRKVYVIDGDGSMLGSSIMPVLASVDLKNLIVICLDNGTYGSTGNQINQAYSISNIEFIARACGIHNTSTASTVEELKEAIYKIEHGLIHVRILPGNSDCKNISLTALEIKKSFSSSL